HCKQKCKQTPGIRGVGRWMFGAEMAFLWG
ncbi:unnamed protein product, partial [marine sediment metagenome]